MCSVSFPPYGSEDRARTVVVDIIEGHTLVTQDPSIKGVPPSPRCDSVGSLPVSPPCPTPEHSAVDICERYTDTGRAPALQVSDTTDDIVPNIRLEKGIYTAVTTHSPEANEEDSHRGYGDSDLMSLSGFPNDPSSRRKPSETSGHHCKPGAYSSPSIIVGDV